MNIILAPFSWLLTAFYNLSNSYGIAIILFAIVVKVILFPFSLKGKKGMVKMTMLQGQVQRIQKQYANNREKMNQEIQDLYAKNNASPMGGCLWSFLPLLFLLPLYAIIRQPLTYMMGLTAEQVVEIGNSVLNWSSVAVNNGWIKEAAELTAQTAGAGYNQLYLASLIKPENLAAVQAVAPGAFAINFNFLGMNLAQVPAWKIWTQTMNWNNIGLFLMPIVSAVLGLGFSFLSVKTNNMNSGEKQAAGGANNFMMYILGPAMSLWIGYAMPAGLCVYWIINNILSMVQEVICGKLLKKDYEAAAEARRKQELLEKEEEKRRKTALAEERAKRAAEKKKGGKKKKEPKEAKEPGADNSASRVGIRAYARGRAYDPDRFGGVTAYRDPDHPVDEEAVEAAREAKAERREEAELEAEVTAKVAAEMDQLAQGTAEDVEKRLEELHEAEAGEVDAEADALASTLEEAADELEEAWEQVTSDEADETGTEEEKTGEDSPKEE